MEDDLDEVCTKSVASGSIHKGTLVLTQSQVKVVFEKPEKISGCDTDETPEKKNSF